MVHPPWLGTGNDLAGCGGGRRASLPVGSCGHQREDKKISSSPLGRRLNATSASWTAKASWNSTVQHPNQQTQSPPLSDSWTARCVALTALKFALEPQTPKRASAHFPKACLHSTTATRCISKLHAPTSTCLRWRKAIPAHSAEYQNSTSTCKVSCEIRSKDSAAITQSLHSKYAAVEGRLSDIQLLTSLSHEKLNNSLSALAGQSAAVREALAQSRVDAEESQNVWGELAGPLRSLHAISRLPHARESAAFYVVLTTWVMILGLSGRYQLGPFVLVLSGAAGVEVWIFDSDPGRGSFFPKAVKGVVIFCFLYMTMFHFERATLGNIYTRLNHLERSAGRPIS